DKAVQGGSTTSNDEEKLLFQELLRRKSKPSCVADEIQSRSLVAKEDRPGNSILGKITHLLAWKNYGFATKLFMLLYVTLLWHESSKKSWEFQAIP
ncbi:hypothetical protein QYM36_008883, partial [Artemia franciscana]